MEYHSLKSPTMGSCSSAPKNATATEEEQVQVDYISDDDKIRIALSTNVYLFGVVLGLYWIFHRKSSHSYYHNPLKRGFGPVRPINGMSSTECAQALSMMRGRRACLVWPC